MMTTSADGRQQTLEDLARLRFGELSPAELKVLEAVCNGVLAHCGEPGAPPRDPVNDTSLSNQWGCRVCQASLLPDAVSFPPWFVRLFRWIDIVAGWFFTSLFVAGISRLVRSN